MSENRIQPVIRPHEEGCNCQDCLSKKFTAAIVENLRLQEALDDEVDETARLREAVRQLLEHIEGDEATHGRSFAAGRVGRAALSDTSEHD